MKYPQLVSTRAVNAISDWLVSRLEQLGVEAPLIYSRLLLSLLQSSVQINDPIEFSNLETFLANRKGNSKRYPPCDTDTLKKITAVQCLMDIVSSEQEISKIENLVDELCEKVNDIEKQSTNLDEDDDLQIAASALNSVLNTRSSSFNRGSKTLSTTSTKTAGDDCSTAKLSEVRGSSESRKTKDKQSALDAEDPRKRYYRAFPALSKEMEDSIGVLRRNTKSLTWPVDRKNNSLNKVAANPTSVVPTIRTSTSTEAEKSTTIAAGSGNHAVPSALLTNSQKGDSNTVLGNTAGVKRKTKRRRNQAMSKGKTTAGNNIRKNSYCGGSSSPTWDTDFEGSWEMGRDLIKEFIVKQNNRNRSTSESGAYNMASSGQSVGRKTGNEITEKRMKSMVHQVRDKQGPVTSTELRQEQQQHENKNENECQLEKMPADQCLDTSNYCEDLVENSKSDDTLASVSEITEGSLSTARRLYERDISNDSLNDQSTNNHPYNQQSSSSEQLDFAQFKAKFNSSVEALWKNSNSTENVGNNNQSVIQSNVVTKPNVPHKSEDLKNFWTNYYSHHYDVDKFKQMMSNNECSDYSMAAANSITESSTHGDGHSDYYSMPTMSNGGDDFDKSVGGKRAGGKISPIGVFLQNTIWSENSVSDDGFFTKILNSTASSTQKTQDQYKMDMSSGERSFFYPYHTSKWSEGINGVPHGNNIVVQQQQGLQQSHQQPLIITSSSSSSSISTMDHSARSCYTNDFADSTPSSSSSYLGGNPNWQNPVGNNLQADVKSWNLSNPTSLTELYGGSDSSLGKKNSSNFDRIADAPGVMLSSDSPNPSAITLTNHSTSSCFVAYSTIKSYVKVIDSESIGIWKKPEIEHHHTSSASAGDDENLLTSERTHFHPIKMSYADGHTFEISSTLDTVEFERSESGYLYLESEKYLEYTRSDILAEEDGSVAGYNRTSSLSRECTSSVASTRSSQSEFVIKFKVRTTDKGCQTEANLIGPSILHSSITYQMASAHLPQLGIHNMHHVINDESVDEDDWMDLGCNSAGDGMLKDDKECVSMNQWSMAEIGRKCADNNNSLHTLWGMCSACNNDMKSIPANKLMKAELNIEADEIMSDLRYMQDLYIGSDWEDQNGTKGDGGGDDDDTDLDAETIRDCELYQAMATPAGCGELEEDPQQSEVVYNMNKLIADLLRPENAQNLAHALGAVGVGGVGCLGVAGGASGGGGDGIAKKLGAENEEVSECMDKGKDEKYIGGLWNSDENIIWKKEFNPIDIFSRLNNNNNDSFLEKLNWEYSNLAEIWGKASPDITGLSTEEDCSAKVKPVEEEEKNEGAISTEASEDEENMKIACKNMKNLLKSSNITQLKHSSPLFEMNDRRLSDSKRLQCLLGSSKFKICNRFDRKRRHSASQNIVHINNNSIIHNNNNIYDNKNLKHSLFGTASNPSPTTKATTPITTTQTKQITKDTLTDNGRNITPRNNDDEAQQNEYLQHYNDDQQQENNSQATIITCKYWTTLHSIIGGSVDHEVEISDQQSLDIQEAEASFFIDKNSQFLDGLPSITLNTSSILSHVTLVSRPLTR